MMLRGMFAAAFLPIPLWAQSIELISSYHNGDATASTFGPSDSQPYMNRYALDEDGNVYYGLYDAFPHPSFPSESTIDNFRFLKRSSDGAEEVLFSEGDEISSPSLAVGTSINHPHEESNERVFDVRVEPNGLVLARVQTRRPGDQFGCDTGATPETSGCPEERAVLALGTVPLSVQLVSEVQNPLGPTGERITQSYAGNNFPSLGHGERSLSESGRVIYPELVSGLYQNVQIGIDDDGNPIYRAFQGGSYAVDYLGQGLEQISGIGASINLFGFEIPAVGSIMRAWSPSTQYFVGDSPVVNGLVFSTDGGNTLYGASLVWEPGSSVPSDWHNREIRRLYNSRAPWAPIGEAVTDDGVLFALADGLENDLSGKRRIGIVAIPLAISAPGVSLNALPVAFEGQQISSNPADGTFAFDAGASIFENDVSFGFNSNLIEVDNRGGLIFSAFIRDAGPAQDQSGFGLFYRSPNGVLSPIVTTLMDNVPGLPVGTKLLPDDRTFFRFNTYAFHGELQNAPQDTKSALALASNDEGQAAFIMKAVSSDPALNGAQVVLRFDSSNGSLRAISKAGDIIPGTSDRVTKYCRGISLDENDNLFDGRARVGKSSPIELESNCLAMNRRGDVLLAPGSEQQARSERYEIQTPFGWSFTRPRIVGSDKIMMIDREGTTHVVSTGGSDFLQAILPGTSQTEGAMLAGGELFMPDNFNDHGEFLLGYTFNQVIVRDPGSWDPVYRVAHKGLVKVSFREGSQLCRADFNSSGSLSPQDLFDFLAAWQARSMTADFTADGMVSLEDLFQFLRSFLGGCGGLLMAPDVSQPEYPEEIAILGSILLEQEAPSAALSKSKNEESKVQPRVTKKEDASQVMTKSEKK